MSPNDPVQSHLLNNRDRLTDEATFETDLVYNSGPSTTHRLLPEKDHECFLQDWFKKRGPPNDEEFEMLQEFLRVDLDTLYEWCKLQCG